RASLACAVAVGGGHSLPRLIARARAVSAGRSQEVKMRVDAFHNWRRELEAVEQEMNSLMAEGVPASSEERQVRRTRFAALIERREAAARNLLRSDSALRRGTSPA